MEPMILYELRFLGSVRSSKKNKEINLQSQDSISDLFTKLSNHFPLNGEGGVRIRHDNESDIPPFDQLFEVVSGKIIIKIKEKK